ncbi:hypothetical protein ACCO45_001789 [Purpureocillium lilacinum]|uniref:Uncharacterized protein n=1 Tax=Purpureocillium lilacinum TaxID=33203 RepID=A0ACC4E804_PURLI
MKGSLLSALTATLSLFSGIVQSQLVGIPTVPFSQSGDGGFQLRRIKRIVVDSKFADERDTSGLTLIPPTLHDFANTFAQDLHETLGLQARVVVEDSHSRHGADGDAVRATPLTVDGSGGGGGIVIAGASPLGAWWGTRTVLQQAVLRPGSVSDSSSGDTGATFPLGTGVDAPGWGERGMMLDCARHFYPKEFLADLCSYMSFFKQNTLQLHLSDNIIASHYTPDNFRDLYARFRLWSDGEAVRGLSTHRNESYSRDEFDWIQRRCAARGVAVLPEIEAPGHALPIVQWKPQVGYEGDLSLLNISHPDTIPTMKTIWKEFLPWFHSKVVSIGADEYLGPESEYKKLVNALDTFIQGEKGTPSADEISTDVSIQHWAYAFDNPLNDYLKNNYSVINSDEMYYVVIKCCAYARRVDISKTFTGDPADKGPGGPTSSARPRRRTTRRATSPDPGRHHAHLERPRGQHERLLGGVLRLAGRHPRAGGQAVGGNLTRSQFDNVFPKLHGPVVPAQNLERTVPSRGSTIFKYDLSRQRSKCIKDLSPNRYHAKTTCRTTGSSVRIAPECSVTTPLESKGRNYTLSLTIKVDKLDDPTNTTILTGGDSTLMLTPNLALFAAGIHFRLDKGIPLKEWVTVKVVGRGEQTFASVESKAGGSTGEMEFQAGITQGDKAGTVKWFPVAVEAPIRAVTGWTGSCGR